MSQPDRPYVYPLFHLLDTNTKEPFKKIKNLNDIKPFFNRFIVISSIHYRYSHGLGMTVAFLRDKIHTWCDSTGYGPTPSNLVVCEGCPKQKPSHHSCCCLECLLSVGIVSGIDVESVAKEDFNVRRLTVSEAGRIVAFLDDPSKKKMCFCYDEGYEGDYIGYLRKYAMSP